MNTPSKTNDDNWPDSNLAFYQAVNSRLEEHQNFGDDNHSDQNDDHVFHGTNSNQLHHQIWQEGNPDYLGVHAFQNILQKLQEIVPVEILEVKNVTTKPSMDNDYKAAHARHSKTHHDHKPDKPGKFIHSNTSNIEDPISSFSHENNSTIDNNSFEFVLSRINQSLGLNTTESVLKHSNRPETSVQIDMPKETHHEKDGIGTQDTKNLIEGEYHENRAWSNNWSRGLKENDIRTFLTISMKFLWPKLTKFETHHNMLRFLTLN